MNQSLCLKGVPQYAYSCRKHQTRAVRNQSRVAGTVSALAAWQRPEGTTWSPSAQVVCWPAAPHVHSDFLRKLGVLVFPWELVSTPWEGVLAWKLEGRIFLNLSSECPHILHRGVLWAAASSLLGSCQRPSFPGRLRAPSPHQTRQAQAKENLEVHRLVSCTGGPAGATPAGLRGGCRSSRCSWRSCSAGWTLRWTLRENQARTASALYLHT